MDLNFFLSVAHVKMSAVTSCFCVDPSHCYGMTWDHSEVALPACSKYFPKCQLMLDPWSAGACMGHELCHHCVCRCASSRHSADHKVRHNLAKDSVAVNDFKYIFVGQMTLFLMTDIVSVSKFAENSRQKYLVFVAQFSTNFSSRIA